MSHFKDGQASRSEVKTGCTECRAEPAERHQRLSLQEGLAEDFAGCQARFMDEEIGRHRPVHLPPREWGNRSVLIFVTLCTKDRRRALDSAVMRDRLLCWWAAADRWRVGRYVIMPDHIHFFCTPGTIPPSPLRSWMAYWKNGVSRETGGEPLWQRDFWDTQLRAGESYAAKWEYVRRNPVRHGLVVSEEDWPYQGEIHRLEWHD